MLCCSVLRPAVLCCAEAGAAEEAAVPAPEDPVLRREIEALAGQVGGSVLRCVCPVLCCVCCCPPCARVRVLLAAVAPFCGRARACRAHALAEGHPWLLRNIYIYI